MPILDGVAHSHWFTHRPFQNALVPSQHRDRANGGPAFAGNADVFDEVFAHPAAERGFMRDTTTPQRQPPT